MRSAPDLGQRGLAAGHAPHEIARRIARDVEARLAHPAAHELMRALLTFSQPGPVRAGRHADREERVETVENALRAPLRGDRAGRARGVAAEPAHVAEYVRTSRANALGAGHPQLSDYSQRMSSSMVARVRAFNRVVTERVGALDEQFLGRGRPHRRVAHAVGDRPRRRRGARAPPPAGHGFRVCEQAAALARGRGAGRRRDRCERPPGAACSPERGGRGRARRARPAVGRAGPVDARAARRAPARGPGDVDADRRAALAGVARDDRCRGSDDARRALVHRAVLRRACGALRGRIRSGAQHPGGGRGSALAAPACC